MTDKRAVLIAAQNDLFRRTLLADMGRAVTTRGVFDLGPFAVFDAVRQVANFDQFTEDNDPYGEHDFGVIIVLDRKLFWKIDYFSDAKTLFGSRDPSDLKQTYRVLTIMLAEEY